MVRTTTNPEQAPNPTRSPAKDRGSQTTARFLNHACLLLLGLASLALISSLLSFHVANLKDWMTLLLLLVASGGCIGAWFNARKGNFLLAAWLLVSAMTVGNTFLFVTGSDASFLETLSVFMLDAILAMMTLGMRVAYGVVIWGNLVTIFLWLTNGIFIAKNSSATSHKMGFDDLVILIAVQLLTIWLVNYLVKRLVQANQITKAQADQLTTTLAEIERKRQLGEETSQRVLSLSAQLHTTANQQAVGSKEQADTLTQVITFMKELTQTSQVIAGEATQLKEATRTISNSAFQAKAANHEVKQMSENSALAIQQTTERNQQVNVLYLTLSKTLTELSQSQDEIKKVVKLIRDLGNQTHLLALNAALEAAGAGE